MNTRTWIAALVLMAASGVSALHAQTAASPDGNEPMAQTTQAVPIAQAQIKSRALTLTSIPQDTPMAIDLGALTVPGISTDLTDGVTLKAYSRYIDYEGKKIAQVVLTGVEKDGRTEDLPASSYSSQFELETAFLKPTDDVVIEGDPSAIISALEKLSKEPEVDPKETLVTQADGNQPQKQDAGQPEQSNDQAASWQSPDPVSVAADPVENTIVTTDGCPIKPYVERMEAVQQSKTVTMKNGTIMSESECSDSNETMPIQRSYLLCDYDENVETRKAMAQYQLYYVDPAGNRQDVQDGACIPDPEKEFTIVEKSCPIFLDYTAGAEKAVPQSSLIYLNDNNREVQVRGCQASETVAAVDMTPTLNGCSIRDDFTKNKSYEQGRFTYQLDGITYQAGDCTDTGTEYPQSKVYADAAGTVLCTPVTDANNVPTALQSRIKITVNGIDDYRTPCTPDASGSVTITATTNGCDNPAMWEHNFMTGQSFGMERYFFMDGGQPRYVTQCQNSQTTYPHGVEITGWQPHDDQLFAYPLTTVYITPPTGRYNIKTSEVLQGAVQQPYELTGTTIVANGQASYVGCDKYAETDQVEQWKRPDLTVYQKPIGTGTPVGPTYDCTPFGAQLAADWTLTGSSTYQYISGYYCPDGGYISSCGIYAQPSYATGVSYTYEATRVLKRNGGDQAVVASETKSVSTTSGGGQNPDQATATSLYNSAGFSF